MKPDSHGTETGTHAHFYTTVICTSLKIVDVPEPDRCNITSIDCLARSSETALESSDVDLMEQEKQRLLEDHRYVKPKTDEYNKCVSPDLAFSAAQIKRSIYHRAGFEIVSHDSGQAHDLQKEEMFKQKHYGHPLNFSRQWQKKGGSSVRAGGVGFEPTEGR